MTTIEIILFMLLSFIISIFIHELGHLLYFEFKLKRKVRLYFKFKNITNFGFECGEDKDYIGLTEKELSGLYLSGILLGGISLFIFTLAFLPNFLLFIPYILGSFDDIKEYIKINKITIKTILKD